MKPVQSDSATESDEHEPMNLGRRVSIDAAGSTPLRIVTQQSPRAQTPDATTHPASDSSSSPHRPVKKAKATAIMSSDEESGESKKNTKAGNTGVAKTRGTRQPIRRGAKRF